MMSKLPHLVSLGQRVAFSLSLSSSLTSTAYSLDICNEYPHKYQ